MECLHSVSLVILKGLCSFNGLFSLLSLVFSFFFVNFNSFLLQLTVYTVVINNITGVELYFDASWPSNSSVQKLKIVVTKNIEHPIIIKITSDLLFLLSYFSSL